MSSADSGVDDVFEHFVRMRCGASAMESPPSATLPPPTIFWYCTGELRERLKGGIIAKVEGFDVCTSFRESKDKVVQLGRKIFFYRDPVTNEVLTEFEGKPVQPIKFDYQIIEYNRTPDGAIIPSVVQGAGAQKRVVPCLPMTAMSVGSGQMVFQAPLFIDAEIPGRGRYQAWEIYDFSLDTTGARESYMTWIRQGASPPFSTEPTDAVMHLTGKRITSFNDLPESCRELIVPAQGGGQYQLHQGPPLSIEEIEELQKAAAATMSKQ